MLFASPLAMLCARRGLKRHSRTLGQASMLSSQPQIA